EASLLADGCLDALIIWSGEGIPLDGHQRLRICHRHNLTPEAVGYLRGKRYLDMRHQGLGGSGQRHPGWTSYALAEEYKVGERTIRLDAKFARAVDAIADNCGEEAKGWILTRDAGLTKGEVVRLARTAPTAQRRRGRELMFAGK